MKILVDTQSVIWFSLNSAQLSQTARTTIEDQANECFVSMATFWEMSIKINLGKIDMDGLSLAEFMDKVDEFNFSTLNITREHVLVNGQLPLYHPDPFDRLIISQAIAEQMPVVSNDPDFDGYPIQRIW